MFPARSFLDRENLFGSLELVLSELNRPGEEIFDL